MNRALAIAITLAALACFSEGAIQEAMEANEKSLFPSVFLPNYLDSGRFNVIRMIGPVVTQQVQQQQQPFDYYDAVREEDHQLGRRTFFHEGQVKMAPSQRQGEIVIVDGDTAYDDDQAQPDAQTQTPVLPPQQPTKQEQTSQHTSLPEPEDPEFPRANFRYPSLSRRKLVSNDIPAIVRSAAVDVVDRSNERATEAAEAVTEPTPEPVDEDDHEEQPPEPVKEKAEEEGKVVEEEKPTASNEQSEATSVTSPDSSLDAAPVTSSTGSSSQATPEPQAATELSETAEPSVQQSSSETPLPGTDATVSLKPETEISSMESGEELRMPMVAGRGPRLALVQ